MVTVCDNERQVRPSAGAAGRDDLALKLFFVIELHAYIETVICRQDCKNGAVMGNRDWRFASETAPDGRAAWRPGACPHVLWIDVGPLPWAISRLFYEAAIRQDRRERQIVLHRYCKPMRAYCKSMTSVLLRASVGGASRELGATFADYNIT
ncbi:hypothetical protein EVAR_76523_1 [Eumeta japonica]|uniref:Uncharacterized protein n=1 Tax=Eumeta variegata TaxID=151549 RepID=A0A4C1T534_EUMVA|nr:hypothetical protein EVAR_76523_1 [Eumeta japonica]